MFVFKATMAKWHLSSASLEHGSMCAHKTMSHVVKTIPRYNQVTIYKSVRKHTTYGIKRDRVLKNNTKYDYRPYNYFKKEWDLLFKNYFFII